MSSVSEVSSGDRWNQSYVGERVVSPTSDAGSLAAGVRLIQGKRLAPPSAEARRHSDQFYQALRARTGKTLASLEHMALNRAHTNYVQMLEEISEEQNVEIVYRELPELSDNGEWNVLGSQVLRINHLYC